MKDLINFFFSFDKLMKEKLVPAFYWAALIYLAIFFVRKFLKGISLDPLAWIITPLEGLLLIVMAFVGVRVLCELAIAVFRINDNLSPDGGKSELADIDPLAEARKAAEEAAKMAREVTGKAVDKTKSAASNLKENSSKTAEKVADKVDDIADSAEDAVEDAVESVKESASKIASKKKPSSRKSTTTKKSTSTKSTTTKKKTAAKKPATTKKRTTKKDS